MRNYEESNQLPLELTPISWFELSDLMAEHNALWLQWEAAKAQTKKLKADYDQSYIQLRACQARIRLSAEREGKRVGTSLANRQSRTNTETGEVSEG
jgi:hypothetical protein